MAERIPEYDDLKLEFAQGEGGSYTVIAESADGRRVRGSFAPPFTGEELDDFVRDVALVRRARRSQQGQLKDIEEFGSGLFAALIREQVADVYHGARTAAQERKRGLRITLNLSGAPELMRLPWEFLYRRPRFLSQSMHTPVVRTLDLESARRPQEVQLPLRILGMVSSPSGYPELDADEERRKLEVALSRLRDERLVELEWLERATLWEFGRRVAEPDEIHVLHYIGHGAYDETTESGVLVLETPQGRAQDIPGRTLGSMLQDEESLRLVVLNSCEGARASRIDPFSGVAASLLQFDIPAVVGMQFEITDEAAIAFSEEFYRQLAHGLPVDAALGPARRAIVAAGKEAEFGTPVLFLRAADARLFEPSRLEPASPTSATSPAPQPDRTVADLDTVADGQRDESRVEEARGLSAETFAGLVDQVAYAASTDEKRPVLTGVLLEATEGRLTAAATDSFRMAVKSVVCNDADRGTALVPANWLHEVASAATLVGGEIRLAFENDTVSALIGERRLMTHRIDGQFPNYRELLPSTHESAVIVDRIPLVRALRYVASASKQRDVAPVSLLFRNRSVMLRATSRKKESVTESLEAEIQGPDLAIAFNPPFLLEALEKIGARRVRFEFMGSLEPAVLRPLADNGDDDYTCILMPMKLA
jgi:hypothetical protein